MKNLKNLPCKDCITKVICRNELCERLLRETYINGVSYRKVSIHVNTYFSIYYTLCTKCILLKNMWNRQFSLSPLENTIMDEFQIDIGQIKDKFIEVNKKMIEEVKNGGFHINK